MSLTPELMRAYLTRPEIHPIEDSCAAEKATFDSLMEDPFRDVGEDELGAFADRDTADNYRVILAWRDHLIGAGSLEAGYMALFSSGKPIAFPPVFIDQILHIILRGILDGAKDPMRVRASELFFREQAVSTEGGILMLADQEIVEMMSQTGGFGGLGALLVEAGTPMRDVSMDVLTQENKEGYWERSDRFDTAIDFRFTEPAQDAFARVVEAWLRHFLKVEVNVQPVQSIKDERWSWHVGLDAEANRLLNALYEGEEVQEADLARILALFRMEFADPEALQPSMRGKPVYLGLAMDGSRILRMKPQNLLTNLPLAQRS